MQIANYKVVFQEVPDEISVAFIVTGCSLHCKGCHSSEYWNNVGTELTVDKYLSILSKNELSTCVAFFGGEWTDELPLFLDIAIEKGFKTCLYTGETEVSDILLNKLHYLKTGPWIESLGGLNSENTNQIFRNLITGEVLNYKFLNKK